MLTRHVITAHRGLLSTVAIIAVGIGAGTWAGASWHAASAGRKVQIVTPADQRLSTIANFEADNAQVFAMEWTGDVLWFVDSAPDGSLTLHRKDGDAQSSWALPGRASYGPFTFLVIGSTGIARITANYTLWQVDTTSGIIDRVELPSENDFMVPGANDPGAALPGTWINGLVTSSSGDVFYTRNNVTALFRLSDSLDGEIARVLDFRPSGLGLRNGEPTPYGSPAELAVGLDLHADDQAIAASERNGCRIAASPEVDRVAIQSNGAPVRYLDGLGLKAGVLADVSPEGVAFALSTGDGRLLRGRCAEGGVEVIQLETRVLGDRAAVASAPGGVVLDPSTIERDSVVSLAISDGGVIGMSESRGQVAVAN